MTDKQDKPEDDAHNEPEDDAHNEPEDEGDVAKETPVGVDGGAYGDLGKHLKETISSLGLLDDIAAKMADIGKWSIPESKKILPSSMYNIQRIAKPLTVSHIPIDDSKWRTARAAEATAEAAKVTASFTRELLTAMERSVVLSEQTRQENSTMAKFTRRMSIASLVISLASVAAAVAAIIIAIFRAA